MTVRRYVFVIEQGLGHVVHGMNIEQVLAARRDISPTVIRLTPGATPGVRRLPVVRNWSAQASWETRRLLVDRLASDPPDAVFVHTQVAALLLNRVMQGVPTIVSLDATPRNLDTMGAAYHHSVQSAPIEWAKLRANKRTLHRAKAIVTWSPWAARSVVSDYGVPGDRVHAIYPGVNISAFAPDPARRTHGPVRLLFVGGDFTRKGGPELLRAAAALGAGVELDVVTSSAAAEIPAEVVARVHHGVPANSVAMTELYRRADVFVLPTHGDCTPLVLAEAMASGLPIVASSVGAIPDMVAEGVNGFLVAPGDIGGLTRALSRLVADGELRLAMAAASRAIAERDHDVFLNCRRIFDLMDAVSLAGPRSSGPVAA